MSKYTKDEQTEIVRWAMKLEAAIQSEQEELARLKGLSFKAIPAAPKRQTIDQTVKPVKPAYPPVPQTTYTFSQFMENECKTSPTLINKFLSKQPLKRIIIVAAVGFALSSFFTMLSGSGAVFRVLGVLFGGLTALIFPLSAVFYFKNYSAYRQRRDELNRSLASTPEYLQARAEAEQKAKEAQKDQEKQLRAKQEELDRQYTKEKETYDTVIVPKYNMELSAWKASHEKKIRIISEDLSANRQTLAELYEQTGIISKNNRSLSKLVWLYEDMSTSEHDLERATDMLNADQQLTATREITDAVVDMDSNMRTGFNAVYSAIERGNDISAEMVSELGKVRRDIDLGNITAAAQRRKTNKHLTEANRQFAEFSSKF